MFNKRYKGENTMIIGTIEICKCQYCGGKDLRYGYLDGSARMCGAPGFAENQEIVHNIMCGSCGSIVYSWVKTPRKYSQNIPESAI